MGMKFNCPKCAKPLNIPERMAGQDIRCPQCKSPFTAPTPTTPVEPVVPVPPSVVPTTAPGDFFEQIVATPAAAPSAPSPQRDSHNEAMLAELRQANRHLAVSVGELKHIGWWIFFWSMLSIIGAVWWGVVIFRAMR